MSDFDKNVLDALIASNEAAKRAADEEAALRYRERNRELQKAKLGAGAGPAMPDILDDAVNIPPIKPRLTVYRARELDGAQLPPVKQVVRGLLSVGLSVLAGSPKIGKSWLALALCIAVAEGRPFLARPVCGGDVLYLDLESRKQREQSRLQRLCVGPSPDRLYIAHDSDTLGGGRLLAQLDDWIKAAKQPALIVIDTLGRVKAGTKKTENAYEGDTRIFGELQKFAMQHDISVLMVHHLKKSASRGEEPDWFERITGSMGMPGVCDCVLGLFGDRKAAEHLYTLKYESRDFAGGEMILRMQDGVWALQSEDSEAYRQQLAYQQSEVARGVIAVLGVAGGQWQGTATDLMDAIVEATGQPLCQVSRSEGLKAELDRVKGMLYEQTGIVVGGKRTNKRRLITLSMRQGTLLEDALPGGDELEL